MGTMKKRIMTGVLTGLFVIGTAVSGFAKEMPISDREQEIRPFHDSVSQIARNTFSRLSPAKILPGTVLPTEAVAVIGIDRFFYVEEISDETFARMWGKSFKEDCTTPREDLRYIRCLHKDIDGNIKVGELVMNRIVADTVCEIVRKLFDASFPIESMLLVDEFDADDETSIMSDNTSAFNFRTVNDTDEISNHAYGLAIDINPYYNVYYIPSKDYIFPPEGWEYLDREADFPYKVEPGDLCYELFTEAGFEWGGWWTYNTDYQHFQYIP